MVLVASLLVLGAGFCLFDGGGNGDLGPADALDLCLGMLAVPAMVLPSMDRLIAWGAVTFSAIAVYVVARRLPDPPPRPALSR
jgi:hypothetical protein